jgi:hypothetical protein
MRNIVKLLEEYYKLVDLTAERGFKIRQDTTMEFRRLITRQLK